MYSGGFQSRVYSEGVFRGCIPRVYSEGVFRGCIPRVIIPDGVVGGINFVFGGGHLFSKILKHIVERVIYRLNCVMQTKQMGRDVLPHYSRLSGTYCF